MSSGAAMSAEAAFTHTWQVGRWTVTLSAPPLMLGARLVVTCEWAPDVPGRPLTDSERRQYEAGRDAALAAMAATLR